MPQTNSGMNGIERLKRARAMFLPGNYLAGIMILFMALIPVVEILLRELTGSGLIWSSVLFSHLTVWIAWLGVMIASRDNAHLSLASPTSSRGNFWSLADSIKHVLAGAVNMAFAVTSISFLIIAFSASEKLGVFPIRLILSILPAGFLFMSLTSGNVKNWYLHALLSLVFGVFFAWPSFINLISSFWMKMPSLLSDSVDGWYETFVWLRWPLIVLLIFLAFRGLPIYVFLGGAALFLFSGNFGSLETLPNEAYNLISNKTISTIPLFTIVGFILSESRSSTRLVRFFRASLGWLPGGLSVVVVVSCAYFTTFTGASGITILALGGLLFKILVDSKQYNGGFARGLITSSGSVGLLFPPALPVIMYGVSARINIKDMFLGGLLPGLLLVLVISTMGVIRGTLNKPQVIPFNRREFLSSLRESLGDLLLPFALLFCYFAGITNLIESAAFAVIYSLILTIVKGDFSKETIVRVLQRSLPVIGGILIILSMAKGLSFFIVDAEIPSLLTHFFSEYVSSKFVFLILLNVALLITGAFLDIYSAILIAAPLIIPLGELYNVHPVQLGIIFLANLQLGYLTPPVGMNLFLASYTFEEPVERIYKQVLPFLLVLFAGVLLITYVPWLSLLLLK